MCTSSGRTWATNLDIQCKKERRGRRDAHRGLNLVGVTRRVVGVELRRRRSTLHTKRSLQGSGSEKEGSERLLTPGRSDLSSSPGLWRGGAAGPRWHRAPCQQWRGGGGSGACWRLRRGVVRAPRCVERQIKEAAGVLGVRALDGKAGEDRGRDWCHAGIADRAAALRDPGLGAQLLEGGRARGGWLVGPAGSGRSTAQRGGGAAVVQRAEESGRWEEGRWRR